MLNKKLTNIIFNITIIIIILFSIYIIYYLYTKNTNGNTEPFDFYTCTMNLKDIDPMFVNEYMKYDGKSVVCGPCKGATLKMNIMPCPNNPDGTLSNICKQNANIVSSNGKPVIYPSYITPINIKNFFCF